MTGSITFINQVYVGFRATVNADSCAPGVESMDCGFFTRDECPWDEVAYPQVNDSIRQAYDDLDSGRFDVWQAEMTDSDYVLRPVSPFCGSASRQEALVASAFSAARTSRVQRKTFDYCNDLRAVKRAVGKADKI